MKSSNWLRKTKVGTEKLVSCPNKKKRPHFLPQVEILESRLAPALTAGTVVNATALAGSHSEVQVAINPLMPQQIALVSNGGALLASSQFIATSGDAGATWTQRTLGFAEDGIGGASSDRFDGSVAYDSFGNLHVAYMARDFTSGDSAIMYAFSSTNGISFTTQVLAPLSGSVDKPWITTGSDGGTNSAVYVTFLDTPGIVIRGAQVTGLGAVGTFTPAAVVTSSPSANYAVPAVGPNGEVAVTWQDPAGGEGPGNVGFSRDLNGLTGGLTFSTPTIISSTNVGGFDFVPATPDRSTFASPFLAYDCSNQIYRGRLYVAYADADDSTIPDNDDTNIFVRYSDNDGTTWSSPVKVNNDTTNNSQFFQNISVDPISGVVFLSWYDARLDNGGSTGTDTDGTANTDVQFGGTASLDGGQTFLPNILLSGGASNQARDVTDPGNDFGDYTGIAAFGLSAISAWADNSNSTGDNPDGNSMFDEYTNRMTLSMDFGDAPNSYGTLVWYAGAGHNISGPRLGATVNADLDGQPSTAANLDTGDDGVTFTSPITPGGFANITVNVQNATNARLNFFLDYNGDGDFLDGESYSIYPVISGNNNIGFSVPIGAVLGPTYARFRLSTSTTNLGPLGLANDGEVEDYQVNIVSAGSGVTITQSGGSTNVTEGGATDTYTVVLNTAPTANVVLTLNGGTQLNLFPAVLPFTPTNWNVPQTVTVTAVDDTLVEGPHTGTITTTVSSSDTNYNVISVASITVNITDNDTSSAGITLTQSGGSTNVTEGGATDTYTLVLTAAPTNNVTVTLNPGTQLSVSPSALIFTTVNWSVAQTVTVTAVDDTVFEGVHAGTITHTVTSADAAYNGLSVANLNANITDNDSAGTPGVTLTQTGGATNVTEGGATDSYTVRLNTAPTSSVTIAVLPGSQLTVSPATLIFTTTNWNVAQNVTVTAVDDTLVEGAHTGTITHAAYSSAGAYNGIVIGSVTANITDNDFAPAIVILNQSGGSTAVTEGGNADTYTVVLSNRPLANVVITLSGDSQIKVLPTTLTFTPLNWSNPQTVAVSAINDIMVEGPHTGTITHAALSGDPAYNGITIAGVTANITDNDDPNGTEGPDIIVVKPATDLATILITVNGKTVSVPATLPQLTILSRGAGDTITIQNPLIPVTIDGGGSTADKLIVNGTTVGDNTFVLGSSSVLMNGVAVTWGNVESLLVNGQTGNDTFTVQGTPAFPVTLIGNTGTNRVLGPDATSLWNITGINAGTLNSSVKLAGIQNLIGGSGNDSFLFNSGQSVTGQIDGGSGSNNLDYSLYATPITTNLQTSTSTGIGKGGFANITTILGGKGQDKLIGPNQTNLWNIIAANTGTLNGSLTFFNFENLTGGSGDDSFQFGNGRGITGKIDGGGGTADLLDYTSYTTPVAMDLQLKKATGTGGFANVEKLVGGAAADTLVGASRTNTWNLTGTNAGNVSDGTTAFSFSAIENLTGGGASDTFLLGSGSITGTLVGGLGMDTLVGNDSNHAWNISGTNAGTVDGMIFTGVENLRGGAGVDTFAIAAGKAVTGKIDGGSGADVLDLSAFIIAVTINLQTRTATGSGGFLSIEQFQGGSGTDFFLGPNQSNNWYLTGPNAGNLTNGLGSFAYTGFENLTGGILNDNFNQQVNGTWSGMINGGLGSDFLFAFAGQSNTWTGTTLNGQKFTGIEFRQ